MRQASRRLLPALGGLLLLGWGASYLTRPTPGAAGAAVGALAAFDSSLAGAWEPLVTLDGDALDGGDILAMDARHDTLVLAHPHAVSVIIDGSVRRRFGSAITGSPEFIARGAGIAILDSGIAVLDAPLHRFDTWSFDGQRLTQRTLPGSTAGVNYGSVFADGDGAVLSVFRIGARDVGGWWVLRVTPHGLDTLVAAYAGGTRGAAYRTPLFAAAAEGFVSLDALEGRWVLLDRRGTRLDSTVRADHRLHSVPERSRRRVRDLAARMPAEYRDALDIGDLVPSARALSASTDGRWLLLGGDADDATHVEVIDADGGAVGRLWKVAERDDIFLVRGAVYRVREADASLVIERLTLRPPTP